MKKKFYFKRNLKALLVAFIGLAASASVLAQVYTDTTGLIADLEAGIYEEYVLAPAAVTDTFFLGDMITLGGSIILKAQDNLGFKPVVTGNPEDKQSYLFQVEGVDGGADIDFEGIHFVSEVDGDEAINNGTMRVFSENINITITDCEFYDFPSYNTIAKIYNSGGNITLDNVLTQNTAGKIIQVNYKDDDATPNYVPKIGDLTITNSSFIDNYKRIFFELGAGDVPIDENDPAITQRFNAGAENVTIDHCTFFRHTGVDVMQGRSMYEFAGDMAAIEGALTITNSVFGAMGENLNADSAAQVVMDYNYFEFGVEIAEEELDDLDALWSPMNTLETAPIYADTADGAWDLTLQNEADILGSDATPVGDPRWWQESWPKVSVESLKAENTIANIYSYQNSVIIDAKEFKYGTTSIFNITGQMVYKNELRPERTEIQLSQGLYIVKVSTNAGSTFEKVIIHE